MPSAFILAARGYPAMPLARQLAHQRCVLPNPLVLGKEPLKFPAPTTDRDRPVSRRSKPSSRTAFIGEQPNPWELLHPQDAMSRHRTDFHSFLWRRLCLHPVVDFRFLSNHDLICRTGVGVLPRSIIDNCQLPISNCQLNYGIEAFPFGSVVTGSINSNLRIAEMQTEREMKTSHGVAG